MPNRLHKLADEDILYVLQAEDVYGVARQFNIPGADITPQVMRNVQKGVEAYFGEAAPEVMLSALQECGLREVR